MENGSEATQAGVGTTLSSVKKETRGLQLAASGYHDVLQLRSPGNLVTSFPKGSNVALLFELLIFCGCNHEPYKGHLFDGY